jgi:hypothetical protein
MSIKKINEFPEGSGTLTSDDIFLVMDNPSGSAQTKKVSVSVLHSGLVKSNTVGITGASGINNIVQINKTNYDALITKDPNTVYFIV